MNACFMPGCFYWFLMEINDDNNFGGRSIKIKERKLKKLMQRSADSY